MKSFEKWLRRNTEFQQALTERNKKEKEMQASKIGDNRGDNGEDREQKAEQSDNSISKVKDSTNVVRARF